MASLVHYRAVGNMCWAVLYPEHETGSKWCTYLWRWTVVILLVWIVVLWFAGQYCFSDWLHLPGYCSVNITSIISLLQHYHHVGAYWVLCISSTMMLEQQVIPAGKHLCHLSYSSSLFLRFTLYYRQNLGLFQQSSNLSANIWQLLICCHAYKLAACDICVITKVTLTQHSSYHGNNVHRKQYHPPCSLLSIITGNTWTFPS